LLLSAAAANAGYSAMGVGTATCTVFMQQYTKNAGLAETVFFAWAQGYMSGLNEILLRQTGQTKDLQSVPLADQKARLRQYCAANPNATFQAGARDLFRTLGNNPKVDRQ
jgi:hypothetical protein